MLLDERAACARAAVKGQGRGLSEEGVRGAAVRLRGPAEPRRRFAGAPFVQRGEAVGVIGLESERIAGTQPQGAVGVEPALGEIAAQVIDVTGVIIDRRGGRIDRQRALDRVDRRASDPSRDAPSPSPRSRGLWRRRPRPAMAARACLRPAVLSSSRWPPWTKII